MWWISSAKDVGEEAETWEENRNAYMFSISFVANCMIFVKHSIDERTSYIVNEYVLSSGIRRTRLRYEGISEADN